MSHTFCLVPISKQYADLHQLLQGTSQDKCQDKLLDLEVSPIWILCHVARSCRVFLYVGNIFTESFSKSGYCTIRIQ